MVSVIGLHALDHNLANFIMQAHVLCKVNTTLPVSLGTLNN